MKLIFLDIDGVLNNWNTIADANIVRDGFESMIDPARCALVQRIINLTGARICLSTSWRIDPRCKNMLISKGLGNNSTYVGQTPNLGDKPRADEIRAFLRDHPQVESFVILDDDEDACIDGHFVHTSMETGLTEEHVKAALRILGYTS